MNVITAIQTQEKRGCRVSIFVDGEFVVGAHEDVAAALNLRVGQSFDGERLAGLVRAETARKARESALRLLSYRERTHSEIRTRLIGNNYPEDVVDEVIDQLAGIGLLDDGKFSRDYVEARKRSRPMGRTRLARELASKGVEKAAIEEALEGVDEDAGTEWLTRWLLVSSRNPIRAIRTARSRIGSMLARRGFCWDVISKVLGDVFKVED